MIGWQRTKNLSSSPYDSFIQNASQDGVENGYREVALRQLSRSVAQKPEVDIAATWFRTRKLTKAPYDNNDEKTDAHYNTNDNRCSPPKGPLKTPKDA